MTHDARPARTEWTSDPVRAADEISLAVATAAAAMLCDGIREVDDHFAAQLVASEVVGTWWSPVGVQDDAAPARLRRAARALLARLGDRPDDTALAAVRALQVGGGPEWSMPASAVARRLCAAGCAEPVWWPPGPARVGHCFDLTWAMPEGRYEVLVLELLHGALPLSLAVLLDPEGAVGDVLLVVEPAELLDLPVEEGGQVEGDARWRTPAELGARLRAAIDRTDLLGVGAAPRFVPGSGYPPLRGLLRTWVALTHEHAWTPAQTRPDGSDAPLGQS
ncbi:hypothetical protein SK069_10955 [Patulibacter brassicae]|uniref:Uncharacterized protein n=1 Tax=Patulibacter brassicae TaxID=1705717 RepID=A0ABU4VK99_9ACTN|nr:hypothetical protein [Patulibacter brassicae]MDX8152114.1 hypothetical protein [Patulibacter brassicae]